MSPEGPPDGPATPALAEGAPGAVPAGARRDSEPPPGPLSRAWARLRTPLWHEPLPEKERRWQRLVLQGPIGFVVGACFGILASDGLGADPFVLAVACAAGGFTFMYLLGQAESWLRLRPRGRGGVPPVALRIGADLVGGGVLGWALSGVLGTDAAATLLAGASLLVGYSFALSHLLWGNVVDDLVRFASGNAATPRGPDFSREEALAARGRIDEALDLYEAWCELRPGSPEPMLRAAWMLREARRYEESVEWYRRALAAPKLDPARADGVARHIWEIAATKLGDPSLALPDLERLIDRWPDRTPREWILDEIEELRAGRSPEP